MRDEGRNAGWMDGWRNAAMNQCQQVVGRQGERFWGEGC